jgi:hypothetical protein
MILLKLGQNDRLSLNELEKTLRKIDRQQLYDQLKILNGLVTKTKANDLIPTEDKGFQDFSDKYMLTEEGHDAVDWLIVFPELKNDNYPEKLEYKDGQPKMETSNVKYWIISAIIIIVSLFSLYLLWLIFHFPAD